MNREPARRRGGVAFPIQAALLLFFVTAAVWAAGFVVTAAAEESEEPYHLKLAAGQPDGAYFHFAKALAKLLDGAYQGVRPLVDLEVVETDASLENLERLQNGDVEAAILQSDIAYDVWHGGGQTGGEGAPERVRGVAALFPETLHVIARADLGIDSVAGLRGKRIAVGSLQSGSRFTATNVLSAYGIGPEVSELVHVPRSKLQEAFAAGRIDAAVLVAAMPSRAVERLLAGGGLKLLSIDRKRVEEISSQGAALRTATIPEGSYPGLKGDVASCEVDALLCTAPEVPDLVVAELIVNCTRPGAREELKLVHPAMGRYGIVEAAERIPIPLHDGAMHYYEEVQAYPRPVKVYTSLYLVAVTDLDIKSGSYGLDFYLWFRWRGRLSVSDDGLAFEIVNGRIEQAELQSRERYGGWTYLCYRVRSAMRGQFPLQAYPFDRQVVSLQIEPPDYGTNELVFVPDDVHLDGSARDLRQEALNPELTISDWRILDARQRVEEFLYPTDFGSPYEAVQGRIPYSRYIFEVELGRVLVPYLVKSILPLTIIVAMAFAVFFIHPKEFEVQAGIVITALLSCVAFHISQADALPDVGYLVTADKFFLISYLVIFFALVQVVVENHIFHKRGAEAAFRIDRWSRVLFPLMFLLPVIYIFWFSAGMS